MGKKKKMTKVLKKYGEFIPPRLMNDQMPIPERLDFTYRYPEGYTTLGKGIDIFIDDDHDEKCLARLVPSEDTLISQDALKLVFTNKHGEYLHPHYTRYGIPILVFDWDSTNITLRFGCASASISIDGNTCRYNPYLYDSTTDDVVKERLAFPHFDSGDRILEEIFYAEDTELTLLDIIEARIICIIVDPHTGDVTHINLVDGVDIDRSKGGGRVKITGCTPIRGLYDLSDEVKRFNFYTTARNSVVYSKREEFKSSFDRYRRKLNEEDCDENQG